ncbi:MAG: hypothetical protein ABL933_17405 [Methyloglobulus sp.]|nr:hypothetical protein [Methyloglobulus sp.]
MEITVGVVSVAAMAEDMDGVEEMAGMVVGAAGVEIMGGAAVIAGEVDTIINSLQRLVCQQMAKISKSRQTYFRPIAKTQPIRLSYHTLT